MKSSRLCATALAVISISLLAACGGTAAPSLTTMAQAAITTAAPAASTPLATTQVFPTTNAPGSTISATTPPSTPLSPATNPLPPTAFITITSQAPIITTAVAPATTVTPPAPTSITVSAAQPPPTEVTVNISLAGFSPSAVTIAKNGVVNMRVSGHDEWKIGSDDGQPDLTIGSGVTMPFMFFEKGTVTYHLVQFPELKCVVTII